MKEEMLEQLQRYYALWKESNAMYEDWAKAQGLSSNGVLVLYSFYESAAPLTQKAIAQKWCIPKQTVNTILKDFAAKGYIEQQEAAEDKRNKLLQLTPAGREAARRVIPALHEKELVGMEALGLERMKNMNDTLEQFIRLFREGETKE